MPYVSRRNGAILLALLVILVVSVGAYRKQQGDLGLDIGVSEAELDELGDSIEELAFDDLEGVSERNGLGISEDDLDSLEEALNNLDFEDLEGLSDN